MAVRNLDALNRRADLLAQEKENAKAIFHKRIDDMINIIEDQRQDIIDAIDTMDYMEAHGMRNDLERILKKCYLSKSYYYNAHVIKIVQDAETDASLGLTDRDNALIHISHSSRGGNEGYAVFVGMPDRTYDVFKSSNRSYDELLNKVAANLASRLKVFFDEVNNL